MSHLQYVRTQLSRYIREYEATESSKPVPLIFINSKKFIMAPSDGAERALRYQCDPDEPDDDDDYY